jgi:hypothetical protein
VIAESKFILGIGSQEPLTSPAGLGPHKTLTIGCMALAISRPITPTRKAPIA